MLVFGNPKVGTKLMQDSQPVALDLPLKVSIWEDERQRVWVGYQGMAANRLSVQLSWYSFTPSRM